MRKLYIITLLLFISVFTTQEIQANDYLTYQDMSFEHQGARLLEDYTESEYKKYYKKIKKRRFWGWRVLIAQENEKAYFTKETLYVIVNDGTSEITETFSFKTDESYKKQYSASGTIGVNVSGDAYGFKLGLEETIKFSATTTATSTYQEDFEIRVHVDPQTKLTVTIEGEGKVSNGVAKYYRFFRQVRKGGWEIFIVTTEYYSLVKEKLNDE